MGGSRISQQPPLFEKIKAKYGAYPKPMMVNDTVAKTMPHKSQTRRLKSKWKEGDVLWVREPVKVIDFWHGANRAFNYQFVDGEKFIMDLPKRFTSIPRWIIEKQGVPNGCIKEMARDFRIVTGVRVERLQDISIRDMKKEGICFCSGVIHCENLDDMIKLNRERSKKEFVSLWDSTAPKGYKYLDNPDVFVYEFEKINLEEL